MPKLFKRCTPCEGNAPLLTSEQVTEMLKEVPGWEIKKNLEQIYRNFLFDDYLQTIAFVNAIAWIAYKENHHPYLEVGYNNCLVLYWTHSIKGLSENDFICAKKINDFISN